MDAQTLTGRLRLMLTSSSEEKVGDGFSTVCPLLVALGPQSHPHQPANSSFRPCSYSAAVARQVAELGRCLVVQLTGRLLSLPARLVRHARARVLKISRTWPWKDAFLACWHRLCALPAPA